MRHPLSRDKSSTRPAPTRGLWLYRERDKAVTRAILDGSSMAEVGAHYGLSYANVSRIVRTTCARVRPDWVDATGRNRVWGTPLSELRAQRALFPL